MDGGGDGGGVTGLLLPGLPGDDAVAAPAGHGPAFPIFLADTLPKSFARGWVEGDDTGIGLAADHDDEAPVFKKRAAADAKESGGNGPIGGGVALPDKASGGEVEAGELALGAEGVTAIGKESGRGARAVVVAVGIDKMAGIRVTPERGAGGRIETLDNFVVVDAMMDDQAAAQNGWGAIAGAEGFLPKNGRPGLGPSVKKIGFGGGGVGARAEELGPVLSQSAGGQGEKESEKKEKITS